MNESAVVEDDDDPSPLLRNGAGKSGHFRTGSLNWHQSHAGRQRAAGVMRRLSLSGALGGGPTKVSFVCVYQQIDWYASI